MLHPIDIILIVVYILAMIVVGIACRGRQQKVDDYFTARGGMAGAFATILVGFSIAATLFSGISFLAYPQIVYHEGAGILVSIVCFPIAYIVLRFWFLPRYLAHDSSAPYGFVEARLGPGIRRLMSVMFMLLRVSWMAALIYAPSTALLAAMGVEAPEAGFVYCPTFWVLVLGIGLSSTIYTVLGGIRGVIVTDAIQFVVIAVGVAFTIVYALLHLPVPLGEAIAALRHLEPSELQRASGMETRNLFALPRFDLNFTLTNVIWALIIGSTIENLGSYMGDQMSLQRYLAAGNPQAATRSFGVNIVGAIVVLLMLAGIGLVLAAWYHFQPDPNLPTRADQIFPYFVTTQLPAGIAGLLLAAVLAATMSSMTSGINSLSAAITLDFLIPLRPNIPQASQLRWAKLLSLIIGLLATLMAVGMDVLDDNIFDISKKVLGVFAGPLLLIILMAAVHRRVHRPSLAAGAIAGCAAGYLISFSGFYLEHAISSLWTSPTAFGVGLLFTLAGTALFRRKE